MRLARVVTAYDQCDPTIAAQAESAELDVLQLDYRWPRRWSIAQSADVPGFAPGFLSQLKALQKRLYLDSRLNLLTDAGGSQPHRCAEAASQQLVEHGNADLLVTAVRGDNLLPRLEELMADGVDLSDVATGTRLQDFDQPLIAAQVELGAGPLATALAEGSRIVIAGHYDVAAPAVAAAVRGFDLAWNAYDRLARAAFGATLLEELIACEQSAEATHALVELDEEGGICLYPVNQEACEPTPLLQRLRESTTMRHADVTCDHSALTINVEEDRSLRVAGVFGAATVKQWRVRFTYEAGFAADALLPHSEAVARRANIYDYFGAGLGENGDTMDEVTIKQLTSGLDPSRGFVWVGCRSHDLARCQQFVSQVKIFVARYAPADLDLCGSLPTVDHYWKHFWAEVPRDAVDISVDTRPAKEWE